MNEVKMQAYAYEYTVDKSGVLTLTNLPFNAGEKVEVIIIPRPQSKSETKRYPFWEKPINYVNPTEAVEETAWEIYK